MAGSPGKATAVETRTTGLIAGAASMKVNAAAPCRSLDGPSPNNLRATGTAPHSQPGKAAPPTPAVRIAAPVRRGSQRATRSGETYVAIKPLMTTPKARKGSAWTKTPQNTVAAFARSGRPTMKARIVPANRASPIRPAKRSCIDPANRGRVRPATVTGLSCQPSCHHRHRSVIGGCGRRQPLRA